jgi:PIN domain nuclease of toxin-antitoxin system
MPILSQTLKDHNSETVHPFELKSFMKMYFDQPYLGSTREVLEIDQSITIDALSMPSLQHQKPSGNLFMNPSIQFAAFLDLFDLNPYNF